MEEGVKRRTMDIEYRGKKQVMSAEERVAWVRKQFVKDPSISVMGVGGMHWRMKEIFGKSMSTDELHKIRREALLERKEMEDKKFNNPVLKKEDIDRLKDKTAVIIKKNMSPVLSVVPPSQQPVPASTPVTGSKDEPKTAGVGMSQAAVNIRFEYARSIVDRNPSITINAVNEEVKKKFGMGTCPRRLRTYVAGVRGKHRSDMGIKRVQTPRAASPEPTQTAPAAPTPQTPKLDISNITIKKSASTEEVIVAAVQMLLEDVPGLKCLNLKIDEHGTPTVDVEMYVKSSLQITKK
jgi:hypothetical protein